MIKYALQTQKSPHHRFNEDACFFVQKNAYTALAAVCDGVSSKPFGLIASSFVASNLKRYFQTTNFTKYNNLHYFDWILLTIRKIQRKLKLLASDNKAYLPISTTLTFLLLIKNSLYVVNIGNSRCYFYPQTTENKWTLLTKDHNMLNAPLFAQCSKSNIVWKKTLNAQNWNHLLSYLTPSKKIIINIVKLIVQPGYYLLSTDGLHDFLFLKNFNPLLASTNLTDQVDILVSQALANNSRDDITALMLRVL